jgi:DNA-binding NarL/FixJ family response regulator
MMLNRNGSHGGTKSPIGTMPVRSRILIADDHKLVAELFGHLLGDEFDVVGTVADGCAMVSAAVDLKPDLILVDIGMPVLNGLDAGRKVKQLVPAIKLIYLTATSDINVAAEVFDFGASGYLLKTCLASEIMLAIREVLQGKTYLAKSMSRVTIDVLRWENKKLSNVNIRLTPRQVEVLQLLAEGKGMKEIAAILKMNHRTATYHKYRIREVLGVNSDAEMVRYAIRNHIVAC